MPGTGDDLKQVRPGDPLRVPAGAYNLLMEVARAYSAHRGKPASAGSGSGSPNNPASILILNSGSNDVSKYGVLALGTPVNSGSSATDVFLSDLMMNGSTPSSNTTTFAIMQEPVAGGLVGWGAVAGISQVMLNVSGTNSFTTAGPGSSSAYLVPAGTTGGANIVWRQGGTGTQWAVVQFSSPPGAGDGEKWGFCAQSGGLNGTYNTLTSLTYNVSNTAFVRIGTNLPCQFQRANYGAVVAGTNCLYHASGTDVTLLFVDETFNTGCT